MTPKITKTSAVGTTQVEKTAEALFTAFVRNNTELIFQHVTEDTIFKVIGQTAVQSKEALPHAFYTAMNLPGLIEILIQETAVYGNYVSLNGVLTHQNGRRQDFSTAMVFDGRTGTVVKEIFQQITPG